MLFHSSHPEIVPAYSRRQGSLAEISETRIVFCTTMVLPLKASDTAGIGPLTLFYAVRTFVQAKNIIFFSKI